MGTVKFAEATVDKLNIRTPEGLIELLSKLCGQKVGLPCSSSSKPPPGKRCECCPECMNYALLSSLTASGDWNLSKFNQVLLLLNQPTVSKHFFSLFFGSGGADKSLKQGVVNFRGFALLGFGNFRFAYKHLAPMSSEAIREELHPYLTQPKEREKKYTPRPRMKRALIRDIHKKQRWYLGYISGKKIHGDLASLRAAYCLLGRDSKAAIEASLNKEPDPEQAEQRKKLFRTRLSELATRDLSIWSSSIEDYERTVRAMEKDVSTVQNVGWANTVAYLTSDYLDVYVATSMRESWEYESTAEFVKAVFANSRIKRLRLRHFDPTLSFLKNRIDKGLVEGLMLKRAGCTLYMVQESDTLGKDSELASTLAQGKPVIAYVPRMTPEQVKKMIKPYPLRFVIKRIMLLMGEDRFSGQELLTVGEFIRRVASFDPVFSLVGDEEAKFVRTNHREVEKAKKILASAESAYFDKRANDLIENHPLAIQVHLESGVANGVLVVRSPNECCELLRRLLTNDCEFAIERDKGCTVLREQISKCPFRVVTDDPTLTNSFWNFYL